MHRMNLSECCYLHGPYCRSDAARIQLQTNERDDNARAGRSLRRRANVQNKMYEKETYYTMAYSLLQNKCLSVRSGVVIVITITVMSPDELTQYEKHSDQHREILFEGWFNCR